MKNKLHLPIRIRTISLTLIMLAALTGAKAWAINEVVLSVELNEWYSCPFVFTWDGTEYLL